MNHGLDASIRTRGICRRVATVKRRACSAILLEVLKGRKPMNFDLDTSAVGLILAAMSATMIIEMEAANISRFVTASAFNIWR